MTQEIFFKYPGGDETITFNVNANTIPLRYEINKESDWINVDIQFDTLSIHVAPTYDYKSRKETISVFDSNNNQIDLIVTQEGFDGIDLQCDKRVVLHHSYFDMSEYYNFYVTVYGGKTQELVCKQIQTQINKVWDNSDMYNDFIIKIPKGLSGMFTIKHSEYTNYKKYCKEHNIKFEENKVKRVIEIVQINEEDTIGEMIIDYNGVEYNTRSIIPVIITNDTPITLNVISTKYAHPISRTKYEIIDTKQVDVNKTPSWLSVKVNDEKINIEATNRNTFGDRVYRMKVTNRTNSHQFLFVDIKQKSGT